MAQGCADTPKGPKRHPFTSYIALYYLLCYGIAAKEGEISLPGKERAEKRPTSSGGGKEQYKGLVQTCTHSHSKRTVNASCRLARLGTICEPVLCTYMFMFSLLITSIPRDYRRGLEQKYHGMKPRITQKYRGECLVPPAS